MVPEEPREPRVINYVFDRQIQHYKNIFLASVVAEVLLDV
jgi:hypothetical protein